MVLVHGAPDRSKSFARVVHHLTDLPVTVYDRRGYGKSLAAGDHGAGFDAHADDLIELLDGVPSVVVGQSAGGAVAMLAATRAPHLFAALGVWEPPMVPWDWWVGEFAQRRLAAWVANPDSVALAEEINRMNIGDERWDALSERTRSLLRAEGRAFQADMASQSEPYLHLSDLVVPMVVGTGTVHFDDRYRVAHRKLAELARAELYVGEGAGHPAHSTHPEVWAGLVRATVALSNASHG